MVPVARGAQGTPGQGVRQGVWRWAGGKVARGVRTRSVEKTRVKSGFVFPILGASALVAPHRPFLAQATQVAPGFVWLLASLWRSADAPKRRPRVPTATELSNEGDVLHFLISPSLFSLWHVEC